jgi:hypothetical protein
MCGDVVATARKWVDTHPDDDDDRESSHCYAEQIEFFRFDKNDPTNRIHADVEVSFDFHLTEPEVPNEPA